MVDEAFSAFAEDEGFRTARILKPLYCGLDSFRLLAQGAAGLGAGVIGQALASIVPFAPQLYNRKDVRNDNLVGALPGYQAIDMRALIARTCRTMMKEGWRRPLHA